MKQQVSADMSGEAFAQYRIDAVVGTGGMGVVYRAYDSTLQRPVAIKFLNAQAEALGNSQLLREARAASALNHPNICTVYEINEVNGRKFIVMEFVEGRPLGQLLTSDGLASEDVTRYGLQIADALAHAHERGVIHRDLKSANVLVTSEGRIKVLDFGLARRITAAGPQDATVSGTAVADVPGIAGTLPYLAPEVLRGAQPDARGDVWALGVVLYQMAAGRLPFAGQTGFEIAAAILDILPPALPDRVPKTIASVIEKCLEKEPERRYQRGGEVRSALQTSNVAAAAAPIERRPRRSRTATTTAAVGLTALALAAAFNLGGIWQWPGGLVSEDVIAFAERDWLLVSNFENQTADQLFEKSLDTALAVGLSQSSYVNVVPTSRIRAALRRMKIPEASRIDGVTAREIAQRENLKLVLVPSIAEIGGVYQLSGSLQDPATGATLKSAIVRARGKGDVLNGVDELIGRIRNDLGEARGSISQQSKPLAQVTTSSLEALKLFSLGREAYTAARVDEALPLYEGALRLDPSFAGARAQLGMIHYELRDREKGKELLAQSIKDVDGLTDKERASVVAFHAEAIENNLQKAADSYIALLAVYPDASAAHNNLGRLYMKMGRYDQAAAALKEAIRIDPDTMLTYNSLSQVYLYGLGDLDAAIELSRQQIVRNEQSEFAYDSLGWAWLGKGELVLAQEAFLKAIAINPRATLDLYRLGHTYRLAGRYREARDTFLKVPTIDPADDSAYYDAGVAAHLMGDAQAARSSFVRFRRLADARTRRNPKNASQYLELASVLWRLGEADGAVSAADRGMALDPNLHFEYAGFLALQGRNAEAISQLQVAVDRGYRDFVWMKIHVDLEPLASEPRFQALLAKGLKP